MGSVAYLVMMTGCEPGFSATSPVYILTNKIYGLADYAPIPRVVLRIATTHYIIKNNLCFRGCDTTSGR